MNIAKEQIAIAQIVVYYPKTSFLKLTFSQLLDDLNTAGLIMKWARDIERRDLVAQDLEGPSPIRLLDLYGTFLICAVFMAVSFAIFLLEAHIWKNF